MATLALNNVRPYGEDETNILIDVDAGVIESIGDAPFTDAPEAVSYTHLTLPTIYSV